MPEPELANVREVDIRSFAEDQTICRMEKPTGSRITVKRCYTENPLEEAAAHQLALEEIRWMREQQMYQERVRQAQELAMRQRGFPGAQP